MKPSEALTHARKREVIKETADLLNDLEHRARERQLPDPFEISSRFHSDLKGGEQVMDPEAPGGPHYDQTWEFLILSANGLTLQQKAVRKYPNGSSDDIKVLPRVVVVDTEEAREQVATSHDLDTEELQKLRDRM